SNGEPVFAVAEYLKSLDSTGKSVNTQRTYCYALKQYFEFLNQYELGYENIGVKELSDFLGWLRFPDYNSELVFMVQPKPKRCERTANLILSVVCGFYGYLYRTGCLEHDLNDSLIKVARGGVRKYKDFLYHVTKQRPQIQNYLKIKEPIQKFRVLNKDEMQAIYEAAGNIRDKFLIRLLFETGLRIGEALSLWVNDFSYSHSNGHQIKLTVRGELENGARLKSGARDIHISQALMDLFDDYLYTVLDEIGMESNYVFVKLKGKSKGNPMTYIDVSAVFKAISAKTGLHVTPHLLRHTHATILYGKTKDIKQVQERLGHAQVQTTLAMYVHPSDEDIRHSWEEAQAIFDLEGGAK
ncbi:MAG: tyrosine-type recombinase/integrase, partial [Ethanoligenens sp.]